MRCSFSHIRPASKIDTGGQGRVTFFPQRKFKVLFCQKKQVLLSKNKITDIP